MVLRSRAPLLSIIKLKEWEKLTFQSLHYLAAEQWGDAKHCFLKTESYHRHARFLDSWLKWKNTARVLLTWLLQCEQNLIGWSSVCDLLNCSPTCNALTNTLKKKILCSFKGTGWMPSTIEIYKATTSPTIIRCTDLFRLRTSFSMLFRRRSCARWRKSLGAR